MNVIFKKSSNAPNEYPKTFTNSRTVDCDILEPTSTKTPVLKMTKANAPIDYTHAELFGATYVIRNDFKYDKGFCYCSLVRSAMDTWWNIVKSCRARITRCTDGDPYIVDGLATQRAGDIISCRKIGTAFTRGTSYIFIKGVTNYDDN